jgi:carbon-monoxide dehydrogenase large subunit
MVSPGYIGRSIPMREARPLLEGRGTFVSDLRLPGMLHAAVLRSPHAHARIRRIDVEPALRVNGVAHVLTGEDVRMCIEPFPESFEIHPPSWLEAVKPVLKGPRPRVLTVEKVHYVGEPVAIVVANDRYAAEDGVDAITVEYEELPPVVDPEQAILPAAELVHTASEDNVVFDFSISKGDCNRALQNAPHLIQERYRHRRHCAVPMEGRGVAAILEPRPHRLTVWSSTQVPHSVQRQIATQLGLSQEMIRVIAPNVGGGFGCKVVVYPEEILVPYLALTLKRPVQWIEDRREHFISTAHARDQVHDVELGFDEEGRIVGLRDRFYLDNGAYNPMGLTDAYNTAAHLQGPYKIPNLYVRGTCVSTNKVPNAPYRGAGRPEAVFVMERCIDRIALELGKDPAEIRLRNFVAPEEMPYDAGVIYRDGAPVCYESGNFPATLKRALQASRYPDIRQRQKQGPPSRNRYLGIGIAFYMEGTGVGSFEGARVQIDSSGKLLVSVGASGHGQGHETVFSQIAADLWGLNPKDITVVGGDTGAIPYGCGTFASRSTVNAGSAIYEATERLKTKVFDLASYLLEANPADLDTAAGRVFVKEKPEHSISLAELSGAAVPGWTSALPEGMEPGLETTFYYVPQTVTWANAVHIAVVEVDAETGIIELVDYTVAHDSGPLINPRFVEGQVRGGTAQGIGGAVYEEIVYDEQGQILTGTMMDYLVPGAAEIPDIRQVHLESRSPLNPLGLKGIGEGGAIAPPAAIANAVVDALRPFDIEVTETPLTPDRIRALIRGKDHRTTKETTTRPHDLKSGRKTMD